MSYLFITVIYMSGESEKHTGQVRFRPVVRPLVTTFVKLSILQRTVIVLLGVFGLLISSTSVLYFCTIQTRNLNVFTPFILVHSPVYPYVYRMNLTKKNFILVQYNVVTFHQSLIYILLFLQRSQIVYHSISLPYVDSVILDSVFHLLFHGEYGRELE